MNAIHRNRVKYKLIEHGSFTFSPSIQVRKVHFQLRGPLLLNVAAATSLMHLAEFEGYNNLPFPIDTRYARLILETHFK